MLLLLLLLLLLALLAELLYLQGRLFLVFHLLLLLQLLLLQLLLLCELGLNTFAFGLGFTCRDPLSSRWGLLHVSVGLNLKPLLFLLLLGD